MPDRDGTLNMNPVSSLAAALRALPHATPQPDLWPALARELEDRLRAAPAAANRQNAEPGAPNAHASDAELAGHSRFRGAKWTGSRTMRFVPLALAAGVALAALLPGSVIRQATPGRTPVVAATTAAAMPNVIAGSAAAPAGELDMLHRRSQTLERWIAAVAARAPQDSRDLMAAVEVEDLIGLIDVQLGAAHDRADALPLWRQRVALLEDLATIRGSAYAIAANDDGAPHAVNASLNRIN
jgi:hypothetical protein